MRARLLEFVGSLRAAGVRVSVAEALDAAEAVAVAGVERPVLREALAATVVKDEGDRATFDRLFDVAFPLVGAPGDESRRRRRARASGAGAGGDGGAHTGTGGGRAARPGRTPEGTTGDDPRGERRPAPGERSAAEARAREGRRLASIADALELRPGRSARVRRLMTVAFRDLTARDVAEARDLVRALGERLRARLARRVRRLRRGRLDLRRTIRAATTSGGVPLRLRFRGRRPGRPDLVALCDLSGSVAAASELLLGLLAPAADHFRRVTLFGYVDRLCPVSIEGGHVAPGAPLDLHARSDFGRVLGDLWAIAPHVLTGTTLLLVLGDARNNRLPPRVDRLRALRERVQRIVWLVPEPRARWDTGDSVLGRYTPACDAVFECVDLAALLGAVRRVL